jgi:hypothetical protein
MTEDETKTPGEEKQDEEEQNLNTTNIKQYVYIYIKQFIYIYPCNSTSMYRMSFLHVDVERSK